MRKTAIAPATTQAMTISRSGLQKACRFSGGGVGEEAMWGWMQDGKFVKFLLRGGRVVFLGFLQKHGGWVWFFDGVIVVECMVNVVKKRHLISGRKIRHIFQIYFSFLRIFRSLIQSLRFSGGSGWG
ncbi:hypothetical protein [Tunturibacter empetritectus]|uniref:Uncharacterized protein n=2 Tax=Tunturiibacter empetritectus TaxID=3069691 RepID=A0A7W8MQI6_9BACT|nr:hypothetical protein [Edaphobacter lichenicola]MBB5316603.1 hypothetical protein [Edaphobacter lichenicola]